MRFRNRSDAGQQFVHELARANLRGPIIVLGLPRGGVPVAAEVADLLQAPLEVFGARKIGAPGHEELGIGAVAEGTSEVVVTDGARQRGIVAAELEQLAARAREELERQLAVYRPGRGLPDLTDQTVILVDDGLATGVTAEAALRSLRTMHASRLVLAVPVAARATLEPLRAWADLVICLEAPANFYAVGQWYDDFTPTTDQEVLRLLARTRTGAGTS